MIIHDSSTLPQTITTHDYEMIPEKQTFWKSNVFTAQDKCFRGKQQQQQQWCDPTQHISACFATVNPQIRHTTLNQNIQVTKQQLSLSAERERNICTD